MRRLSFNFEDDKTQSSDQSLTYSELFSSAVVQEVINRDE